MREEEVELGKYVWSKSVYWKVDFEKA